MKKSKENFQNLINSYLDEELPDEKLDYIAKLIAENKTFANMFCEYRSIHIATAKYYSKQIKLQELPKYEAKRPSVFMGNLEWAAVFALMIVCGFLLKREISSTSEKYIRSFVESPFANESFSLKVQDFFDGKYSFYSLLDFSEE